MPIKTWTPAELRALAETKFVDSRALADMRAALLYSARLLASAEAVIEESSRISKARAAGVQGMQSHGWEWRFFDTAHEPSGWGDWKPLEPHTRLQTMEDAVAEMRAFIQQGYRYQLRQTFAGPPEGYNPDGVTTTVPPAGAGAKVYCCYGAYSDAGHDADCKRNAGVKEVPRG